MKLAIAILTASFALLGTSCQENEFKGNNQPVTQEPAPPVKPREPLKPQKQCLERLGPLNVMIAIDVTESMQGTLRTVKDNLMPVLDRFSQLQPAGSSENFTTVRVGFVSFGDNQQNIRLYRMADSQSEIRNSLEQVSIVQDSTNQDGPEMAIGAVKVALEELEREASQTPSTSVLLVITDNFGHNDGTISNRDYSMQFLNNRLRQPHMNHLIIYDSAPQFNRDPRIYDQRSNIPPFATPADQWQSLRDQWRQSRSTTNLNSIGRSLGFPLSGQSLNSTLPTDLSNAVVICE